MKKIFAFLLINVSCLILCWITLDFIIYNQAKKTYITRQLDDYKPQAFRYRIEPYYDYNINNYFKGKIKSLYSGRTPDGLEYSKNKNPITIFGCSFAHGQYLEQNQTFSFKLSQALKRPVYNRAIPGKGLAQMYHQSTLGRFYKDVPKSDTVIYIMVNDHYRRMKLNYIEPLDTYMLKTYKKEGNKLKKINDNNPIKTLFNSSYTIKWIRSLLVHNYINNPQNADNLTDEALTYFIETRKNLQKKWGNDFQFIVIFYFSISYKDKLRNKLEDNGFVVIDVEKDFNLTNLYSDEYTISEKNKHPNEKAWDLLTPLIIEKLEF